MFVLVFLLLVFNILFFAFEYISFRLNGEGVNDSVFYHLLNPIEGAGFKEFKIEIFIVIIILLAIITIFLSLRKINFSKKYQFLSISFFVVLLFFNPGLNKTVQYVKYSFFQEFRKPSDYLNFEATVGKQRNLFFIYLESLENTYSDESVFPGLTPNINKYKKEGLDFSSIEMPTGSEWTIAGMVASQCGMPLVTSTGSGNSMGQTQKFLPKATCLGDVLKKHGYINYYYGGADTKFAGKKNFYIDHGFHEVSGLNELKEREEVSARSAWGIYDDELFEIVKNDYKKLDKNQKYAWFILNLDTHHPFGHVSPSCENVKYGDGSVKILNAVHCTDFLLNNFIKSIRESDPEAIIVIASDHLAMPNDAKEILLKQKRKNLFLILNNRLPAEDIKKSASTYDIAPTVLSLMGFENEGMGWGRNLMKNNSLLNDFSDVKKFNDYVKSFHNFNKGFHGYHQSFKLLKKSNGHFELNGEIIKEPFAIKIDKKNNIEDIFFPGEDGFEGYLKRVIDFNKEKSIIFVDECKKINSHADEKGDCYLISKHKWNYDKGGVFSEGVVINDQLEIKSWDEFEKVESNIYKYIYRNAEIIFIDDDINIISNSFGIGSSKIETIKNSININRGINFYAINSDGYIDELDSKDFCDQNESSIPNKKLLDFIENKKYLTNYFIYLVHDTAWCNRNIYEKFIKNIDMNIYLEDVDFREAAIFIKKNDYVKFEKSKEKVVVIPFDKN